MLRWIEVGIVVLAFMAGFGLSHYRDTAKANAALVRAQAQQMQAADLASRKEAERLASEAARADLSRQLEDAANAQTPSSACLPLSRVVRLNQR